MFFEVEVRIELAQVDLVEVGCLLFDFLHDFDFIEALLEHLFGVIVHLDADLVFSVSVKAFQHLAERSRRYQSLNPVAFCHYFAYYYRELSGVFIPRPLLIEKGELQDLEVLELEVFLVVLIFNVFIEGALFG